MDIFRIIKRYWVVTAFPILTTSLIILDLKRTRNWKKLSEQKKLKYELENDTDIKKLIDIRIITKLKKRKKQTSESIILHDTVNTSTPPFH